MTEGGHVSGKLAGELASRLEEENVRAIGADGIEIVLDQLDPDGSYHFGNLKPGKWTIRISDGQGVLAEHPVEIIVNQMSEISESLEHENILPITPAFKN